MGLGRPRQIGRIAWTVLEQVRNAQLRGQVQCARKVMADAQVIEDDAQRQLTFSRLCGAFCRHDQKPGPSTAGITLDASEVVRLRLPLRLSMSRLPGEIQFPRSAAGCAHTCS